MNAPRGTERDARAVEIDPVKERGSTDRLSPLTLTLPPRNELVFRTDSSVNTENIVVTE